MVRKLLIVILFFTFLTPCILEASPSVDVPLDHWSYDAIEKLAIIGLCDIADIGIRPVSRIKMAHIVETAIDKARDYDKEFNWNEQDYLETLLNKLISEYRVELVEIGVEVASTFDQPLPRNTVRLLNDIKIEKVYARLDKDSMLFENKDGWILKDGFNARIQATSWAKFSNICAVSVTPGIRYSKENTAVNIEDAHLRINPTGWNTEYAIGRSSMWWGPGFRGTILMSNNAFPLNTLRINNVTPFRLPWIFKNMGRFCGNFFVTRMDNNFTLPHAMISGWKLDYIPCGFLKLGLGHVLMFGGKGVNMQGFSHLIGTESLFFSAGGGGDEPENHIMSWDIQLFLKRIDRFLPIATGVKLYSEWGAEDESKSIPVDLASITGAYFTDVFKIPGFDLKAEIARFNKIFYTHFRYTSGYTNKDIFIGHEAGPDSEDMAVTGIFNFPDEYKFSTTLSRTRRGLSQALIEITDQIRLEFSLTNALNMYNIKDVEVTLFFEFQDIQNFNNTGSIARNKIFGAEVTRKF